MILINTVFCYPRCEVGLENWVQCNDAPVKICKYPVTGLQEGRSYIFRVRAVNSAGISRPSRVSEPVAALDPVDLERTQSRLCKSDLLFFFFKILFAQLTYGPEFVPSFDGISH